MNPCPKIPTSSIQLLVCGVAQREFKPYPIMMITIRNNPTGVMRRRTILAEVFMDWIACIFSKKIPWPEKIKGSRTQINRRIDAVNGSVPNEGNKKAMVESRHNNGIPITNAERNTRAAKIIVWPRDFWKESISIALLLGFGTIWDWEVHWHYTSKMESRDNQIFVNIIKIDIYRQIL